MNPAFAESIAPTPILTATQAGMPQSLRYSPKFDFAPRVGFAWRITDNSKTVHARRLRQVHRNSYWAA